MTKGLEALERLSAVASMYCDECATSEEDLDRGMFEKDYQAVKTIEQELKELEVRRKMMRKSNEETEKKLKALEIIKPYIHIHCVVPNDRGGVRIWFTQDGKHYIDMPQEEYELLKEVLNYGK